MLQGDLEVGEKIAKHWEKNPRTPALCDGWPNPVVDHGDQVKDAVFNSQKLPTVFFCYLL